MPTTTSMIGTTATASTAASRTAGVWRPRVLAVLGATAAAVAAWMLAKPVLGVALAIPAAGGSPGMRIGWGSALAMSLVASLAGWGLLALLERLTPRAGAIWLVMAAVALLVSFAGPLVAASAASAGTKVALALMHVAVAAVLIPALAATARPAGGRRGARS